MLVLQRGNTTSEAEWALIYGSVFSMEKIKKKKASRVLFFVVSNKSQEKIKTNKELSLTTNTITVSKD